MKKISLLVILLAVVISIPVFAKDKGHKGKSHHGGHGKGERGSLVIPLLPDVHVDSGYVSVSYDCFHRSTYHPGYWETTIIGYEDILIPAKFKIKVFYDQYGNRHTKRICIRKEHYERVPIEERIWVDGYWD